jgi:hypothetical protein
MVSEIVFRVRKGKEKNSKRKKKENTCTFFYGFCVCDFCGHGGQDLFVGGRPRRFGVVAGVVVVVVFLGGRPRRLGSGEVATTAGLAVLGRPARLGGAADEAAGVLAAWVNCAVCISSSADAAEMEEEYVGDGGDGGREDVGEEEGDGVEGLAVL